MIKIRDHVGSLRKGTGDLAALDRNKSEVYSYFCASVFSGRCSSHTQPSKANTGTGGMRTLNPLREIRFETI